MDAMLLLKASLLLSVAFVAARMLRDGSAGARHRVWSIAFIALLVLPLLTSTLPGLDVPVPEAWVPTTATTGEQARSRDGNQSISRRSSGVPDSAKGAAIEVTRSRNGDSAPAMALLEPPTMTFRGWLAAWIAGTVAATAVLLLSLFRVRRLSTNAEELDDPEWRRAADALGSRLSLRRPARLVVSDAIDTPMAGGLLRPVVYLPSSARGWSSEQRDVVLAHEIAHLAGSDPLRHVTARLAVALYWFHPLAWIAARESTVSREQACDEAVLSLGLKPSTYARVLLELAESAQRRRPLLGALPIVEPSLLEKRLMAILNGELQPAARRRGAGVAIAGALLTISIAAARPAALSSGQVASADPTLVALPIADASAELPGVASAKPIEGRITPIGPIAVDQRGVERDSDCSLEPRGSFHGSMSVSESGGRTIIYEQVGSRGMDRIIQKSLGDLRLCMLAEGVGDRDDAARPSEWQERARHMIVEVRRGRRIERLEMTRHSPTEQRVLWQVDGSQRAFDRAAEEWRDRTLAVLDTTWEISMLRGQVSSLQGEISSVRGQESSLRGEISSLQGEVSSMRGHLSSVQGEESSLRGRISSIQGHLSSLQGAISSEQGAISSLHASRYAVDPSDRDSVAARVTQHNTAIARIEREIRDYDAQARIAEVEKQIRALDTPGKVAAIEADIDRFALDSKVDAVLRRIAELDVQGKTANIQGRIHALDADRRVRDLEAEREKRVKDLEKAIGSIR